MFASQHIRASALQFAEEDDGAFIKAGKTADPT